MQTTRTRLTVLPLFVGLLLTGCFGAPARRPVPAALTNRAVVPDMPDNARMWADELDPATEAVFLQMSEQDYRCLCRKSGARSDAAFRRRS